MKGYLGAVFLSYYYGSKLLQTWRFKTAQIYYLIFCSSELQHGHHWANNQGADQAVTSGCPQGGIQILAFCSFSWHMVFL